MMATHRIWVSIAVACVAPLTLAQPSAIDTTITLAPADIPRRYRLHVPTGYAGGSVPLVLNFHAAGGTPDDQAATSGFDAIADREEFIVVYPERIFESGVDVVQFTRDIIDDVGAKFPIDRDRIYATGLAAGAQLSSRLACELSDILAAAAPVAGLQYPDDCVPKSPISIVAFHGKADEVNHYEVTAESRPDWPMGVEAAAEKWRDALGCPEGAMEGGFRNAPGVVVRVWPPCAGGADLMIYVSETDAHVWPQGASERIWAFFKAHPR